MGSCGPASSKQGATFHWETYSLNSVLTWYSHQKEKERVLLVTRSIFLSYHIPLSCLKYDFTNVCIVLVSFISYRHHSLSIWYEMSKSLGVGSFELRVIWIISDFGNSHLQCLRWCYKQVIFPIDKPITKRILFLDLCTVVSSKILHGRYNIILLTLP